MKEKNIKKILIVGVGREKDPKIRGTPHKLYSFLSEKGYETYFLTIPKKLRLISLLGYLIKFYSKCINFKPDVIIGFNHMTIVPVIFKKFRLIKTPIIFYWVDFVTEAMGRKWAIGLIAFSEFCSLKNSDLVFTNSLFQKGIAKRVGVDAKYFPFGVEKYFKRDIKGVTLPGNNKFKLLYYGDITLYKNVDELISAVKGLKCDLILVGPANEEFRKKAPENVYFIGYVEHKKVPCYIKSADLIAIPTDQDGTIKMFEALRMGKPILGKKGRIGYVLTHLENAYLTNDFREGIKTLTENKKIIKEIQKNNEKIVVKEPNEIFEGVLGEIRRYLNYSNEKNKNEKKSFV